MKGVKYIGTAVMLAAFTPFWIQLKEWINPTEWQGWLIVLLIFGAITFFVLTGFELIDWMYEALDRKEKGKQESDKGHQD